MLTRTIALPLLSALAIGVTASAQTPPAATPSTVEPSIAFAGSGTAVALRSNGDVLTWGDNASCLLGRATTVSNGADHRPTVVMHNAKKIATGGTSVAVLTADGKVYSWGPTVAPMGSGYYPCDGPAAVPSLSGKVIAHVGFGIGFVVAVTDTGDLYCAGDNNGCPATQTRNPDSSFRISGPDPVKTFTRLALPALDGNVLNIRVGGYHTLVLTRDRKLYAFGRARAGQLGDSRFTAGGALVAFTPEPVLTNVVSFAAGLLHSVAVKGDGTVWTWGHNEQDSELCDGATTNRRVPTQLAAPGQVVQVAAHEASTFLRTKDGAVYACGSNQGGRLGLERPPVGFGASNPWLPVRSPRQIPAPAAKSSVLALGAGYGAFSPDGCTVHIAGEGSSGGVRGATEPSSSKFMLRADLSLCAPRSTTPMPDIAAGAIKSVPRASAGVDCWMPKIETGPKDPRLEPIRQAMLTVERVVKENQAFMSQMPERVRMGNRDQHRQRRDATGTPRRIRANGSQDRPLIGRRRRATSCASATRTRSASSR